MTNQTTQIAAQRQHERIPTYYLLQFEELTNAELASMARDDLCPEKWCTFCGWELEYREAVAIEVYYDDKADAIKRRKA